MLSFFLNKMCIFFATNLNLIKMKVKEVMTSKSLKFCGSESKIQDVVKIMKSINCRALPVVDKDKNLLGIISDRDICLSLANNKHKVLTNLTVGQIMPSKTHIINDSDDISVAFQQMHANQINRLPVIDDNGKLKGIISLHKLINKSINNQNKLTENKVISKKGTAKTVTSKNSLLMDVEAATKHFIGNTKKYN